MRCDTFIRQNGRLGMYYPYDPWFDDREIRHIAKRNNAGNLKRDSDLAIEHFIDAITVFSPAEELPEGLAWMPEMFI